MEHDSTGFPETLLDFPSVLVSDFDGTMTEHDFYLLAIERLIPPGTPNFWEEYRAGTISHFEALRRYFAAIRESEPAVQQVVNSMKLDPRLREGIDRLRRAGWGVVVTSAGCDWYIRRLLRSADVEIPVFANPGTYVEREGLVMQRPTTSPFHSENLGVDKTAVVRKLISLGKNVAYAGDGFPDADPARLVPDSLRFARGDLATVLDAEKLAYRPFAVWFEIAAFLSDEARS